MRLNPGSRQRRELSFRPAWPLLALALAALASKAPPSWAAAPTPKPTLGPGDTLDSICGETLKQDEQGLTTATAGQADIKLQSCKAARDNQKAADADRDLYKVWAGVSAVCTGACIAMIAGRSSPYVCPATNAAGSVAEAAYLKEFGNLVTGLLESAGSVAAAKTMLGGKDIGACVIAAHAAYKSVTQYKDIDSQDAAFQSNLLAARDQSSANGTAVAAASAPGSDSSGAGGSTGGSQSGSASSPSSAAAPSAVSAACGSGALLQCAIASDRTLPDFVKNPRFEKDFKSAAGFPLADLANRNLTPAAAVAGSLGASLSQSQVATLTNGLQNLNMALGGDTPEARVASGGASGNAAQGGEDLSQLMGGLMSQLMPGARSSDETAASGMRAVIFANQNRGPAAVAEDKSLNIFDRVTFRYYAVSARLGGKAQ